MKSITFNFETNEVTIDKDGHTDILIVPGLKNRESDILKASGLEEVSVSELADEIDRLFEELGLDVRAAR